MAIKAGDPLEISCTHPTVGNKVFKMKAAEDLSVERGNVKIVADENNVSTAGEQIIQANVFTPKMAFTIASDDSEDVVSYLNDVVASLEEGTFTMVHRSGLVLSGDGIPSGDIEHNIQNGQLPLTITFSNTIQKVS